MSYSMWGAFAETSWWVYLAFIWLGIVSVQASKPHVINFKGAAVYPCALIVFLFMLMPFVLNLNSLIVSLMLLAILPGLLLGWLQFHFRKIKAIKNTYRFYVPGSWGVLAMLITLVVLKFYYYNYAISLDFTILHHDQVSTILAIVCGLSAGMQATRSLCLYRCMKVGPYTEEPVLS